MSKKAKRKSTFLIGLVAVLAVLLVVLLVVAVTEPWKKDPLATDPISTTTAPVTDTNPTTEPAQTTVPSQPEGTTPDDTNPVDDTTPSVPTDPTQPATAPADVEVKTPYATLRFDGQWRQYLDIRVSEGDPYVLEFRAKLLGKAPCPLFDLRFGSSVPNPVGAVKAKDGTLVPVGVKNYTFRPDSSWSEAEINAIHAMQELFNDMMDQLALQDIPEPPATTVPESTSADLTISTPYGNFVFPREYEKYLVTEFTKGQPDTLKLYSALPGKEKILLFTVSFGSGDGFESSIKNASGTQTKIYFQFIEPEFDDSWAQTDINTVYAMQEGINYLIDAL